MATQCNIYPDVKGKKRKFAEKICSPDFDGNISNLCKEFNIARSTYYRWMDDMGFTGYCEWLVNKYTDSELANMWRSLINAGKNGSVEALKTYFDLKGKFVTRVDISGGVTFIGGEEELE